MIFPDLKLVVYLPGGSIFVSAAAETGYPIEGAGRILTACPTF
jgi:hypothetical protein